MKTPTIQPTSFKHVSSLLIIVLIVSSGCISPNKKAVIDYCSLEYNPVMCRQARERLRKDKEIESYEELGGPSWWTVLEDRRRAWEHDISWAKKQQEIRQAIGNSSTLYPELDWLNGGWCVRGMTKSSARIVKILSEDRIEMKDFETGKIESMSFTLRADNDGYYELIADGKVVLQPEGIYDKIRLNNEEGFTLIDFRKYGKKEGIVRDYYRCQ